MNSISVPAEHWDTLREVISANADSSQRMVRMENDVLLSILNMMNIEYVVTNQTGSTGRVKIRHDFGRVTTIARNANKECSICMNTFDKGDTVVILPCQHMFHLACMERWVQRKNVCPLCLRFVAIDVCA